MYIIDWQLNLLNALINQSMPTTYCFVRLAVLHYLKFWNCIRLEIITNKTTCTQSNFTCPPDHQTSISTCPRAKFTCPGQSDLGSNLPCSGGRKTRVPGEKLSKHGENQQQTHIWHREKTRSTIGCTASAEIEKPVLLMLLICRVLWLVKIVLSNGKE